MKTNCQWFESKLEAYLSGDLNSEELAPCQEHLAGCSSCTRQVESLQSIDPLVRQIFQHRMAQARLAATVHARPRVLRLALAGTALAAAGILGISLLLQKDPLPAPPVASRPPALQGIPAPEGKPAVVKSEEPDSGPQLGKPKVGTPATSALQPELDAPTAGAPDFAVIDAAGYSTTLESYRGRVLLFGIVSPEQAEATKNLKDLYDAFGSNPKVRIFGVANRRQDDLHTTMPVMFNHGSRLMGLQNGQFQMLDASGKALMRGTLADPASVTRIKTQLEHLGVQ